MYTFGKEASARISANSTASPTAQTFTSATWVSMAGLAGRLVGGGAAVGSPGTMRSPPDT